MVQNTPLAADSLNGRPLASGEKVISAPGDPAGWRPDHLPRQNHGDDTAQRHGFVLAPQRS